MATENFDFTKLKDLYENGQLKDRLDAKNYLSKHFVPTYIGSHVSFQNGKPYVIQDDIMTKVYLKRFPKDIKLWYNTETIPKNLICDIFQPQIGKDFINIASELKHKYVEYKTFSKQIKDKVDIFLEYVLTVWANGNKAVYDYLLKWFANVVKGIKNTSCLYSKGSEGIGKSTLTDFFSQYVVGVELCCKGKADHLKGSHNMQLLGKLFVIFEELQCFSDKEWIAVDAELKDMISGQYASYVDKYEKRFDAKNINNYVVNTNFNAIKGADGRRYLVLDVSPVKMNDFKYFANIRDNCFNDEIGKAFYCYLMEIDTKHFNSLDIPMTASKSAMCADLLSPLEKFLKFQYLLKEKDLSVKLKQLTTEFNAYSRMKNQMFKPWSIPIFGARMRELGFFFREMDGGYNKYKISLDELKKVAKNKKWLHATDKDELQQISDDEEEENEEEQMLEQGIDKSNQSVKVEVENKPNWLIDEESKPNLFTKIQKKYLLTTKEMKYIIRKYERKHDKVIEKTKYILKQVLKNTSYEVFFENGRFISCDVPVELDIEDCKKQTAKIFEDFM